MLMIKCLIICFIGLIAPFLLGNLITYNDGDNELLSFTSKYILGLFTELSLFWVLCVPMTFFMVSFTILTTTYSIFLITFCGISIWLACKENLYNKFLVVYKNIQFSRYEFVYLLLFLLLLGIQLYFAAFYESTIWSYDDYSYVVHSLDTISSDHMFLTDMITGNETAFSYKRILNSWEIYIAYLSKISGFHVTTIAHTIIPILFLCIAYLVYFFIAKQLFNNRENQLIFMCILSVILIFGLYSPYSLTFRLLVTLWQGKAVLFTIVIPFLIAFLPGAYIQSSHKRNRLYLVIISISACSLTMMGSGMSIAVFIVMLFVICLYQRRLAGITFCFYGCIIPALQILLYLIKR